MLQQNKSAETPDLQAYDEAVSRLPHLSMGDAARLFGLTPRALRYYEERGLVSATRRGPTNGRYFNAVARERLARIAQLRRAGLSLGDIQVYLDEEEPAAARRQVQDCLDERRRSLLAQLDAVESLARILNLAD